MKVNHRKTYLFLFFLSILVFPSLTYADGPYLNIPPTNAFDKIHSDNGTIDAMNFSMPLNIKSGTGISVKSNNSTHTLTITNSALSTIQGTYNITQANNVNVNSGGNKINFINGSGSTVHVENSGSGSQVNVTISSTGSGGTITSINGQTGPPINIIRTFDNITITNSSNTIKINLGNNVPTLNHFNNFTKGLSVGNNTRFCLDGSACKYYLVKSSGLISVFVNSIEEVRLDSNARFNSPVIVIPTGETTSRITGIPELTYNIQAAGEQDLIGGNGFSKIINFYAKGGSGPPFKSYLQGFIGNQTSFVAINQTSDANALTALPNHMCEDYFVTKDV